VRLDADPGTHVVPGADLPDASSAEPEPVST
jgi:hypothetical protein